MIILLFTLLLIALIALLMNYFKAEIHACFERDPAAANTLEVLLTYSGLHALMAYRLAHRLYQWKIPLLPRFISQLSRFFTGIEIHPAAVIGSGCFIDHGMGVVIGETTIIGKNVTLYQGVTLGGIGKEKGKRHPTLGDNIVVGAGAKILGNIRIGNQVAIGANAVVIREVPPNSTVVGVPGRIAQRHGRRSSGITLDYSGLPDPLAQSLEQLQQHIAHLEDDLAKWRQKPAEEKGLEEQ